MFDFIGSRVIILLSATLLGVPLLRYFKIVSVESVDDSASIRTTTMTQIVILFQANNPTQTLRSSNKHTPPGS